MNKAQRTGARAEATAHAHRDRTRTPICIHIYKQRRGEGFCTRVQGPSPSARPELHPVPAPGFARRRLDVPVRDQAFDFCCRLREARHSASLSGNKPTGARADLRPQGGLPSTRARRRLCKRTTFATTLELLFAVQIFRFCTAEQRKTSKLVRFFRFCAFGLSCLAHHRQTQGQPSSFSQVGGMPNESLMGFAQYSGKRIDHMRGERPPESLQSAFIDSFGAERSVRKRKFRTRFGPKSCTAVQKRKIRTGQPSPHPQPNRGGGLAAPSSSAIILAYPAKHPHSPETLRPCSPAPPQALRSPTSPPQPAGPSRPRKRKRAPACAAPMLRKGYFSRREKACERASCMMPTKDQQADLGILSAVPLCKAPRAACLAANPVAAPC